MLAIINYHYDLAAMLLEHGADPNVADTTGMGALFAAVDMKTLPWSFGRPEQTGRSKISAGELIERLLDHKADPNARLSKVLLMRAHTDGDPSVGPGATAYMRAAKAGDVWTMKRLVEHGADPNLTMNNGDTALMLAAGLGWRDGNMAVPTRDVGTEDEAIAAIQFCLDHGADINARGGRRQYGPAQRVDGPRFVEDRGLPARARCFARCAERGQADAEGSSARQPVQGSPAPSRNCWRI